MAAGAILPPLFFEWRRQRGSQPGNGILGNTFKTTSVDRSFERPARFPWPRPANGHRPKDI
jgi:hypothetical protein